MAVRTLHVIFTLAILSFASGIAVAAKPRYKILRFVDVASNETVAVSPTFPAFGSSFVFSDPVYDIYLKKKVGQSGGRCDVLVTGGESLFCAFSVHIFGKGTLQFQCFSSLTATENVDPVTGGSGKFFGATGSANVKVSGQGFIGNFTVKLRLP